MKDYVICGSLKKNSLSSLLIVALLFVFTATSFGQLSGRKISLDPGHGGNDPGALGASGPPHEAHLCLDAGLELRNRLQSYGATVTMTRTTNTTVSLTARRNHFNAQNPHAAISIHLNAFNGQAHGTETFWSHSGGSGSSTLATRIQAGLIEFMQRTNRGVKTANFTVITANVPVCLTEGLFVDNPTEYAYIRSTAGFNNWVRGHKMGVFDYFGISRPGLTGILTGRIYEGDDPSDYAARIAGANVRLNTGASQSSSETGAYSFELTPGTYTVTASKSGYFDNSITREVTSNTTTWGSLCLTPIPTDFGIDIFWSRSDYSWFGEGTERAIAWHNGKLYVANRDGTTGGTIRILNAEDGNEIGTIDASPLSGGTFAFNTVAVSDDGYIFASNLTIDAENIPFRVYVWEDENADPVEIITRPTATELRIGDHISIAGSVEDGTAVLYAPISNEEGRLLRWNIAREGDIYVVEGAGVHGGHMDVPDMPNWGFPSFVAPKGPGVESGFFAGGRSSNILRSYTPANTSTGFLSIPDQHNNTGITALSYQEYEGTIYLFAYNAIARRVYAEEAGAPGENDTDRNGSFVFISPEIGSETPFSIYNGDLDVVNYQDGSFRVFVLATDNAIQAIDVRLDAPISDPEPIPGIISMLPWFEDFSDVNIPDLPHGTEFPEGWAVIGDVQTSKWGGTDNNSTNLRFPNPIASPMAITPDIDSGIDIAATTLGFKAHYATAGDLDDKIHVGFISDPTNASTFRLVETVSIDGTFKEFTIDLSSHSLDDGRHIAFKAERGGSWNAHYLGKISLEKGEPVFSSEIKKDRPERLKLAQNYPNPFNPSTTISFAMPADGDLRLELFDMVGRRIAILAEGHMQAGHHDIIFDASLFSSGIYLYRLKAGGETLARRMTLLK